MINPFKIRPNLTSNLSLWLAALFIAFAIWTIAQEDELTEQTRTVPVHIDVPTYADMFVQPKVVSVTLRYPVSRANLLNNANITVSLGKAPEDPRSWAGLDDVKTRTVRVEPSNVFLGDLPRTFQIAAIDPSEVTVGAKLHNAEARVTPNIIGKPGPGFVASQPLTLQQTVYVIGPPELLARLPRDSSNQVTVSTNPIDISGQTQYFETTADLQLPEGIELHEDSPRRVTVNVPIREETGQRTISGIPITVQTFTPGISARVTPASASVRVEGPLSLIGSIRPTDFLVMPREPLEEAAGTDAVASLDIQFSETVTQQVSDKVNLVTESLMPKSARVQLIGSGTTSPATSATMPMTAPPAE